jgi:putative peptide zinc metalloprotease protein
MSGSVFSPSWHLMAQLKPRLLPHSQLLRHLYRGRRWYVVHDTAKGRYHRLSPSAFAFVKRMDGTRTLQQLWDEICASPTEDVPSQTDIVDLLSQLHANDLLQCDTTPDAFELLQRSRKQSRSKWMQRLTNPLSLKLPLVDPDRFLTRCVGYVGWLFSVKGLLLWLAIVLPAIVVAGQHWRALTENMSDRILSSGNLLLMAALFIPIKLLHELGHGFATKVWGGSVHELGLMFLVFAPVPYVDSSSSAAFESRYRRAVVGAAGMLVEMVIAAIAIYIWVVVEPGLVRAIAYNTIIVAGISTLLMNGNPLLRYDGYYILSDLIEIPNLGQRGQRYWAYLTDRYVFRAREAQMPDESPAEKRWIAIYAIASWCYRTLVTITIILFVAPKFFLFGTIIAVWGAVTLLLMPIWKGLRHLASSPSLHGRRAFAVRATATIVVGIAALVCLVPVPMRTQAEGAYWLPDNAIVRSGEEGFFAQWLVAPGTRVTKGTPVLMMRNPRLEAAVAQAEGKLAEARARFDAQAFTNPSQAEILRQNVSQAEEELRHAQFQHARLVVGAESDGVLMVAQPQDMQDRYYRKGDLLGYVLEASKVVIRVAVSQDNVYLVRNRLQDVQVRPADNVREISRTSLLREVPGGVDELPIPALATSGGGQIPVEPTGSDEHLRLLNRYFLFDFAPPSHTSVPQVGARVYVRFTHTRETLLRQWQRRIRQLFLSRLNV